MISIVSGYYNRKQLFYETLKSITESKYKDIEYIVVDDGSSPEHRLEDLIDEFPFLKVIRLEKENKWYINPCIPFNIGIRESKGDIIVLQNPECLHVHDVLKYFSENINDSNYISISTYGLNPQLTSELPVHRKNNTIVNLLNKQPQQPYIGGDTLGWYNHSRYRPVFYHFCAALTRTNMKKLNGFDERYAYGIGYDDNELIVRIYKLGLKMKIEDRISVIHQYHPSLWTPPNERALLEKNRLLLQNVTMNMKEDKVSVNLLKLW